MANSHTTADPAVATHQPAYSSAAPAWGGHWAHRVRRVSWGAILAGFVTAASLQMLLSMLGLAFGFWSINPTSEENPVAGLATGTGIYWVVTGIISMFIGGCVAAYMCGVPDRWDGALHGMVIWGVVTLVSFWFVGSTFGTVFNATASALGSGLSAVGEMAIPDGQTAANQGQQQQGQQQESMVNFEAIGDRLANILEDTGKEDLSPEQLEQARQRLTNVSQEAAREAMMKPDSVDQQIDKVVDVFFEEWQAVKDDLDKDAAANALASNTDMSEQEARRTIDRWQEEVPEAKRELNQQLAQLEQVAAEQYHQVKRATLETTGDVMDTLGNTAMWSFFAMLLGLIAATGGGFLGTTKTPDTYDAT